MSGLSIRYPVLRSLYNALLLTPGYGIPPSRYVKWKKQWVFKKNLGVTLVKESIPLVLNKLLLINYPVSQLTGRRRFEKEVIGMFTSKQNILNFKLPQDIITLNKFSQRGYAYLTAPGTGCRYMLLHQVLFSHFFRYYCYG